MLEQLAREKKEAQISNAMLAALENEPTPEPEEVSYQELPSFKADLQLFDIIRDLVNAHKQLQDPKVDNKNSINN